VFSCLIPAQSVVTIVGVATNYTARPTLAMTSSKGQLNLTVDGTQGTTYTVLVSTNLVNWQTLLTTNAAVSPLILPITNSGSAHFYRVKVGS
jgi:hypothetical protein